MVECAEQALEAVHATLPRDFPEKIWSRISKGVLRHRAEFLAASAKRT
jgi:hypothetical protein